MISRPVAISLAANRTPGESSNRRIWVDGDSCTDCRACHTFAPLEEITTYPHPNAPISSGFTTTKAALDRDPKLGEDFDWESTAIELDGGDLTQALEAAIECPSDAIYVDFL